MFQNSKELFSIFGFEIRIAPSWLIIAVLIVWSLSTTYFPSRFESANRFELVFLSIISMLCLFLSLILHELSHSLVARHFNLKVGSITLFIFGGVAELEHDPEDAKSEFWIAIAGPIMSFLLAGAFWLLKIMGDKIGVSEIMVELFQYLGLMNLILALFNLLPAFPLDGGRVFRSMLWHFKGNVIEATRIATRFGKTFAIMLIALGILFLFSSQVVSGLWQILIGIFLFGASVSAYEDLKIRQILKNHTVSALMTRNPWIANVDETVQELVDTVMLKHNVTFVPIVEGENLLGYVDAAMIQTIDRETWADTELGDIYTPISHENSSRAEAPIQDVFDTMVQTGNRKILISKDGMLEGVLSLADLMTYLSIRQGLGDSLSTKTIKRSKTSAHV